MDRLNGPVAGTISTTFIEFGLSYVPGNPNYSWQIPMGLQGVPSVVVLCTCWLIPESPRWYIGRGNQERALELLTKYHGEGDPANGFVQLEMRQMVDSIDLNGSDKRWYDFRGLVGTRADRYRFFLVACVSSFSELDLPPTSYYLPLMVEAAGVTGTHTVLLLNALQTPIMMIFALSGLQFIERWGRRPSLMLSSAGMTLSVTMITVCTALTPHHKKAGPVGIFFLYLFLASESPQSIPGTMTETPQHLLSFGHHCKPCIHPRCSHSTIEPRVWRSTAS